LCMEHDPVAFLEETVRIESHDGVERMRDYLVESLTGATVHTSGCVVAEKEGSEGAPTFVLNTHMDTVAPHVPYERDEGVVRGRGSCDAKGPLAAMVSAFENAGTDATVRLVVSPDEETTSQGLDDYLEEEGGSDLADFAVVGEPTELNICTAAKGRFEATVVFHGESAHAASGGGKNAVSCASEAVRRLESLKPSHDEVLGESRLTVTRVEGGESANQVPEKATITLDRRPVPPETEEGFVRLVEDALKGIDCEYEVCLPDHPSPESAAFRTDEENENVRRLRRCVEEVVDHKDTQLRPFGAACEASYIAGYSPVVVFGPGAIDDGEPVAHSEREYVRVEEVRGAAEALTRFLEG